MYLVPDRDLFVSHLQSTIQDRRNIDEELRLDTFENLRLYE